MFIFSSTFPRVSFSSGALTLGLMCALGANVQGCGPHKRSKKAVPTAPQPPPTPSPTPSPTPRPQVIQRNISEPKPLAALAPRWLDYTVIPPAFSTAAGQAVPVDIISIDSRLTFDVKAQTSQGTASIVFTSFDDGLPFLDLVPDVKEISLDGIPLAPSLFPAVDLPDHASKVRVLQQPLRKGEHHTLSVTYDLSKDTYQFTDQGVIFGLFMSDLQGHGSHQRHYLERYIPANFEYDAFKLKLDLSVLNAPGALQVFSNGDQTQEADQINHWKFDFPEYFTASSPYLHVTDRSLIVKETSYQGLAKSIPILVYGVSQEHVTAALEQAQAILKELESDYGPYAHAKLVIYVNDGMGGGMEYCGATATDLWALSHEITHSWFARGVMPADGNSGWIDEAIASWRDDLYQHREFPFLSYLPELAAGSPYKRDTNFLAYSYGADLMSSIDGVLLRKTSTNLKKVLAKLFMEKKNDVITTQYFQNFLESEAQLDFTDYFAAYAYEKRVPVANAISKLDSSTAEFIHFQDRTEPKPLRPFHAPGMTVDRLRQLF